MKKIYIFGAHSRAQTVGVYLTKLNKDMEIAAYLVNNDETNESMIDGIPVVHISKDSVLDTTLPVYIHKIFLLNLAQFSPWRQLMPFSYTFPATCRCRVLRDEHRVPLCRRLFPVIGNNRRRHSFCYKISCMILYGVQSLFIYVINILLF